MQPHASPEVEEALKRVAPLLSDEVARSRASLREAARAQARPRQESVDLVAGRSKVVSLMARYLSGAAQPGLSGFELDRDGGPCPS